jgi:hypothetical protein
MWINQQKVGFLNMSNKTPTHYQERAFGLKKLDRRLSEIVPD